ncbi:hypothetical protein [Corynebacterium casei]|uniref:hypothetical protein n=1 Tax=Actinomycetes TaxID=1760 RepID=UPI003F9E215B
MPIVEPQDVAKFLGRGDDTELIALAQEHLPIVTAFIEAYTRGRGFAGGEPDGPLRAVIITAAARLVPNPEQMKRYQTGDYAETPAILDGFTLPELAILHRYRKRTQ